VNTVILGAFAKVTGLVGLPAILEGIEEYVPGKKEANSAAAKTAYEKVFIS
jgi:Pyruvate/2-oxoacid:ferredoxin oxidoreductase gamma subunit